MTSNNKETCRVKILASPSILMTLPFQFVVGMRSRKQKQIPNILWALFACY